MGDHDLPKPVMFRIKLSLTCAPNCPCITPQFYSFILYIAFSPSKTVTQLQQISLQARLDAEQSIACGQRGLYLVRTLKPMDFPPIP